MKYFLNQFLGRAYNLKAMDYNGKSDPYAVVTYGGQKIQTKVILARTFNV